MPEQKLKGKKVLMAIAPTGFRDEELQQPKQVLEAEGAEVKVASTTKAECKGMLGARVKPDLEISQASADDYDAVVGVGGVGSPDHLWGNKDLHEILQKAAAANKVVGAICLSGAVLARAGVIQGKEATVYRTRESLQEFEKAGARYVAKDVVVSGNVVTAEGPAAATDFGRALARKLSH